MPQTNISLMWQELAAGIASEATLMPVKVLDYSGGGYDITVADGIYYAVEDYRIAVEVQK